MLSRFFELEPFLDYSDADLSQLVPSHGQRIKLKVLLTEMKEFEAVTKELQDKVLSLFDVRNLFDLMISKHPAFAHDLSLDSRLTRSPDFERGVVKVITHQTSSLTPEEEDALTPFRIIRTNEADSEIDEVTNLKQYLARKRAKFQIQEYKDLSHIPPTSNACERLFSRARRLLTDYRKSMNEETVEALLFLDINQKYWPTQVVNDVVTRLKISSEDVEEHA